MTKIMAVNSGSSSLKFQLFEMPEGKVLTSGNVERIGLPMGIFGMNIDDRRITKEVPVPDHQVAVDLLLDALINFGIVHSLDEIKAAGHRIVQGGPYFSDSVKVDDYVVDKVRELIELAPLHNAAHLTCYEAFKKALPNIEHVFVFDTAFHQTMEPDSYLFPVPYEWYTDYKVRRYGAHGTSHKYVANKTAEIMGKDIKDLNLITMHLGSGASITAIKGGKCINTSMGLSPLGGIMMGTRCGDIDPTVVYFMSKKLNCTPDEMETYLNKKSGMVGVSGVSSDSRDVEKAMDQGNERAKLTYDLYVNRVINVVGGYVMQLGHVDALTFTAGLGEHATLVREMICKKLEEGLGLKIDYELNSKCHSQAELSVKGSKVKVYVVPTNEELAIVNDTVRILGL
ncbi:MAG: acetate kinase [Erysipelotrichaceae bacterium]|nr:acetate kinase [Erysipelotrichaceae bacterium]MBR4609522.1 acetate kinase [Erysipelotrichaceae bacterium]